MCFERIVMTALGDHIMNIVFAGSDKQVFRRDAGRDVTSVQNHCTFRYGAKSSLERHPMRGALPPSLVIPCPAIAKSMKIFALYQSATICIGRMRVMVKPFFRAIRNPTLSFYRSHASIIRQIVR